VTVPRRVVPWLVIAGAGGGVVVGMRLFAFFAGA
jgi:hypothetical protein